MTFEYKNLSDAKKALFKTKLYLCSTHFLHNIIKKAKRVTVEKNVKKAFIFSVSLIQNSTSISQIKNYLINIHYMFNSAIIDKKCLYAIKTVRDSIRQRGLSSLDVEAISSPQQTERDKFFQEFENLANIDLNPNFQQTIKNSSKFKTYFDNLIYQYNKIIEISFKL